MKQFKRIYIEITNRCNLQCSFCPVSKREDATMSAENFEKVLQKIKGHGEYIYLHIKGEPLLHPELEQIFELCNKYGMKINLTTNGTLLLKRMDLILNSPAIRQVSISLQSFEDLNDINGFEDYINQVMTVVEKGQKSTKIIFELRLWNYENLHSENKGYNKNQKALDMIGQSLNLSEPIEPDMQIGKGVKLMPQVYLSKSSEFQWPDLSIDILDTKGSCYGLRQQVGILVNGDVVPCCLDSEGDTVLGNIFTSNFEEIVTSTRSQNMINGFENHVLVEPLCMRCGYRERFK